MKPENTIIAFDLHGVVFVPNWGKALRILLTWSHLWQIFLCIFKPRFVFACFRLLFNDPTDEEFFALFERDCPKLFPMLVDLFNAFKPVDCVVELMRSLKKQGFALHIASNIGPRRFKSLQAHFPNVLMLFDEVKINSGDVEHLIKKPHAEFFLGYMREHNPHGKAVVFIDNNIRNIKAANSFGFVGIHFRSCEQLKKSLQAIDIVC